jgi:hypothetical protein
MLHLPALLLASTSALYGGQPPAELAHGRTLDRIEVTDAGSVVQGTPGYDLARRRVWVTYAATAGGHPPRAEAAATLEEGTRFWPTAVAVLDPEHIAVGGRYGESGERATVVEVWRLGRPRVVREGGTARIEGLAVLERTVVYESAVPGRDMVRALVRLRGRPGLLLAQFHDSGDVVELEVGATRSAVYHAGPGGRVILSSTPRPGVTCVPELANPVRVDVAVQESAGRGVVYALRASNELRFSRGGPSPAVEPLELVDDDRDGVIDGWRIAARPARAPSGPAAITRPRR